MGAAISDWGIFEAVGPRSINRDIVGSYRPGLERVYCTNISIRLKTRLASRHRSILHYNNTIEFAKQLSIRRWSPLVLSLIALRCRFRRLANPEPVRNRGHFGRSQVVKRNLVRRMRLA